MPAKSKSQRKAAGMALAAKKGKMPMSELKGPAKGMAQMGMKDLEHYAKTSEKGLPEHIKEAQKHMSKKMPMKRRMMK